MSPAPARPSLLSVARSLGVSTATVSNVFNRPDRVAAPTRERVLAEAARVGYRGPDPAARQLRRGRTDTIGLVLTDELGFAFSDQAAVGFLGGLAEACQTAGRNLVLLAGGPPDRARGTTSIQAAAMDGVVLYSVADDDPHLAAALERGLPVTVVDQPGPGPGWDWTGPDDRAAARDVGGHLAALGHRRVAVITGRLTRQRRNGPAGEGRIVYGVRRDRLAGLAEGLGVPPAELLVEERFESSEEAGADALAALLTRHPDVTAVACLSDALALGALRRARELGLDVPGRLSLTGFDDIGPAVRAGLTTVRQPLNEKGRTAGEFLVRRVDERVHGVHETARHRTLPTSLQIRTTTAPPT